MKPSPHLLLLSLLLLAGCVTTSQYALYQHPVTGDRMECEKAPAGGGAGIYGLGDAPKNHVICGAFAEVFGESRVPKEVGVDNLSHRLSGLAFTLSGARSASAES
jgi:hypothetical protein